MFKENYTCKAEVFVANVASIFEVPYVWHNETAVSQKVFDFSVCFFIPTMLQILYSCLEA